MNRRTEEFPMLVADKGPLIGQRWALSRTLVLGRESTCDVVIADRQVSRFHARLTPTEEGIMVEDLGSKNGTHLNGVALTSPNMLKDGDKVQVGFVQEFLFFTSDATMPLTEAASQAGRLMIDHKSRSVWVNQKQLVPPLSAQQFKLLWLLYENQGQGISRPDLVETVWGEEQAGGVSDQALDALIRRLRDRLAELDSKHQFIDTVRGHGVRLDNPPT